MMVARGRAPHEIIPRWQNDSRCADEAMMRKSRLGPDDFFYDGRFRGLSPARLAHEERLRQFCADCPVRIECDSFADAYAEHGFWAGRTEHERRLRRRKLGITVEAS